MNSGPHVLQSTPPTILFLLNACPIVDQPLSSSTLVPHLRQTLSLWQEL